jgi:hypothetical protein
MSLYYIQNQAGLNQKNKTPIPNSEFSAIRARNIARRYNQTPPQKRQEKKFVYDNLLGSVPGTRYVAPNGLTFKVYYP